MEDCKTDDPLPLDEGDKRTRKRKASLLTKPYEKLPTSTTDGLSAELVEELQYAYEIIQTILSMRRIDPFMVKPDSNLFGMASYYNIIKTPMWLNEVRSKLLRREYTCISQFVADIRLMLENCYRFWGPSHKFTRKGLRIEQKLEQKIDTLPPHLKSKCIDDIPFVVKSEELEGEDEVISLEKECLNSSPSFKGYKSKILDRVIECDSNGLLSEENCEMQQVKEREMIQWERETLVSPEDVTSIKTMWQLAEIGHFLKLTYEVLNIEEVTQYEVERMLLMPQESKTLATLMTSMLSPATVRANLDVTPVMPYAVWTKRLKKRLDDWFAIYYKKCDSLQAFKICGIEPHFWPVMSLMNPLMDQDFHELSFFKRVWILKSLCNYLLHTNRCIQDVFLDEANFSEMRVSILGTDSEGFQYFHLPFLPEIRVYRQRAMEKDVQWKKFSVPENIVMKLFDITVNYTWDEDGHSVVCHPGENDFYLVSSTLESLFELEETFKESSPDLSKAILRFGKEAKKYRQNMEGLEVLFNQWQEFYKRPDGYVENEVNEWENFSSKQDKAKTQEPNETTEVLGKRRSKVNLSYTGFHMSESGSSETYDSESDVSDWESIHHKKKKQNSQKKTSPSEMSPVLQNDSTNETTLEKDKTFEASITEDFTVDYPDIKPQLPLVPDSSSADVEMKPVIDKEGKIIEQLVPFMNRSNSREHEKKHTNTSNLSDDSSSLIIIRKIKSEDDVISISSDEEKPEVKPIIKKVTPSKVPVTINQAIYNTPGKLNLENRNITVQPSPMVQSPVRSAWPPQMQSPNVNNVRPNYVMPSPMKMAQQSPQQNIRMQGSPNMNFNMMQQNLRPRSPQMQMMGTRNPSPAQVVSRVRSPYTPRQRTPPYNSVSPQQNMTPRMRNSGPRNTGPRAPMRSLFNDRSPQSKVPTIEGLLQVGQKPDGSYGYHVKLPDGGIIQMSRLEVEEIRRKNNGSLPLKVEVPLIKKQAGPGPGPMKPL